RSGRKTAHASDLPQADGQSRVSVSDDPEIPDRTNLFRTIVPPIILPVFLAAADGTVVATALPAIAATFGEVERLSWVVVANLIASTVAGPDYGRLADL